MTEDDSSMAYSADPLEDYSLSWQASEIEQKVLDSARCLWERSVQQNIRDANDRANQLKNLSRLSVVIAAFSMSSFLEFNFNSSSVPTGVLIPYGITTAAVAAIYMGCMAMCNLILATVLQVGSSYTTEEEESHFLLQCREFAIRYQPGDRPPAPPRSFRRLWDYRCSASWRLTLVMFGIGVPIFLCNMAISGWIKFIDYQPCASLMTAIMALGLVYLLATLLQWLVHLVRSVRSSAEVSAIAPDPLGFPWDWYLEPIVYPKTMQYSASMPHAPGTPRFSDRETEQMQKWRLEDREQHHLDNAVYLWNQFIQSMRTEMNERAEQLRSLSFLAGILLSFGMAALYQLVFEPDSFSAGTKIFYALTIALTVSLNLCTMTACGFLNMGIVKAVASLASAEEQAQFISRCKQFAHSKDPTARPPHPTRTFNSYWANRCERDWKLAFTTFTLGAVIFQCCLIISAWLKFSPDYIDPLADPPVVDHSDAASVMTVILSIGILYFIYISIRWTRGAKNFGKEERVKWGFEPPSVGLPFDWHLPTNRLERAAAAKLEAKGLKGEAKACVPFQPSTHSPYALVCFTGSEALKEMIVQKPAASMESWADALMEQRHLTNALRLWKRFIDKNTADLEERQEQLQAVTELAAVISGFEMIVFLQFQFDTTVIPRVVQLAYVATSGLTVALMACSLTVCGIMLESLLESSSEFVNNAQEATYITRCYAFCKGFHLGDRPPAPKTSFKGHWDSRCENEWRRAFFMFSVGVPLFLANGAIAAFIKFYNNSPPAILVAILHGLAVLYLLVAHARWFKHLFAVPERENLEDEELRHLPAGLPFDWHLPSRRAKGSAIQKA